VACTTGRNLLLNAAAWTAELPVPTGGIATKTPTADDLERLIGHVRETVERVHGVRLNTEVRIMGAPR